MTKKFTEKTINKMIKDESHAVQDYRKKGLPGYAKEEEKHLNFWKDQKKKLK